MMWQPIETAPMDQFLLLCGPSGYTTTPMVVTTGRMCSDYHAGRWIDHANDDLTEWGFEPTHWAPLVLPGAQPKLDEIKIALHRALELGKRETWTGTRKYRSREDQREEQQCWDKVWTLLGAKGE